MLAIQAVEERLDTNAGYPVVRGSRTAVRSLVNVFRLSQDFDKTAEMFPHLTRDQVREALDYYICRFIRAARHTAARWRV